MPFSLRSDEELIAEAKRALEALGVEVVIDSASSSVQQVAQRNQLDMHIGRRVAIATSRAVASACAKPRPDAIAAVLITAVPSVQPIAQFALLHRNREHLDVGAAAWWLKIMADPLHGCQGFITCCKCRRRAPYWQGDQVPCPQCHADICTACAASKDHAIWCRSCGSWYLEAQHFLWGVPWDMPRPAPTRRQADSPSSALPQRMAAAVGPDGWLRLPPGHQRMHPVDVMVDGVLAALDGRVLVHPTLPMCAYEQEDVVRFARAPLGDCLQEGASLEGTRRRLRQTVDRLMRQAGTMHLPEIKVRVTRRVARVDPTVGASRISKVVKEEAMFTIRRRERGTAAAPRGRGAAAKGAHAWELVQENPAMWWFEECDPSMKVAYLEPERVEVPLAVRRVLRDAHVRLGATACRAKEVKFLYSTTAQGVAYGAIQLDQRGRDRAGGRPHAVLDTWLRQARAAGSPMHAACRDLEALRRAGLDRSGGQAFRMEARIWRLEGLAWQQGQQRREGEVGGAVRWERRGGAGRRGRSRREFGVVFELGSWGEERRALPHWEAARVLVQAMEG